MILRTNLTYLILVNDNFITICIHTEALHINTRVYYKNLIFDILFASLFSQRHHSPMHQIYTSVPIRMIWAKVAATTMALIMNRSYHWMPLMPSSILKVLDDIVPCRYVTQLFCPP